MLKNQPFETNGEDYLKNIVAQEAVYQSSENSKFIVVK
jgi:hypothetical protein